MADAFSENIEGVRQLIQSGINKTISGGNPDEGVIGEFEDILTLKMDDSELLSLRDQWENEYAPYHAQVTTRQKLNKLYYQGLQKQGSSQKTTPVASNLLFESEETFIPQALSKNPEPVVWSDNTDEGKTSSDEIKTMLQYHADVLCLRRKLGVMVRHWSIYFLGIVKHGWDAKIKDITSEIRKPQNFILDPNGFVDEYGNFDGGYLGERIECSAEQLIDLYPEHKSYITIKANGKLGTNLVRTEWWTNEFCFTTFGDKILDKHKNEFFNYDKEEAGTDEYGLETTTVTPGQNHFARPKMPYTFLSVFSLQEKPHDVTNLIEQNIANQDRINDRNDQIDKNLRHGNNSIVVSGISFNSETAAQASRALEQGDPVLVPDGRVDDAIKRVPANSIPNGVFDSLEEDKNTLRGVFGIQGLSAQAQQEDQTARGMILNQSHDSTRIGGGIGDALEQVADNIFNWWLQLYYVFYDEPHYAAIMGGGQAVQYIQLIMTNQTRKFVVSVSPNSMKPKDEISEQNAAIELANAGWLDPINLFKKLSYPDPQKTAEMVTMWKINPQQYFMNYFGQQAMPGMTPPGGGPVPPEQGSPPQGLGQEPANASLSAVPLPK